MWGKFAGWSYCHIGCTFSFWTIHGESWSIVWNRGISLSSGMFPGCSYCHIVCTLPFWSRHGDPWLSFWIRGISLRSGILPGWSYCHIGCMFSSNDLASLAVDNLTCVLRFLKEEVSVCPGIFGTLTYPYAALIVFLGTSLSTRRLSLSRWYVFDPSLARFHSISNVMQ